jgi:drug/metabolite transporter (DMT)-like permease
MNWIFLAVGGQFLNAIVSIFDKYIVSDDKALPRPFVYAFYSCLLTGFWAVIFFIGLVPGLSTFGVPSFANVQTPSIQVVALSFLAAYTFFMALVSMYDALKRADASTVMPIVGSIAGLTTFGLNYYFLEVVHSNNFIWGIILLTVGTMLVAQTLPRMNVILHTVHSGLFFGFHWITMKGLFLETTFDNGFFWSRVGFILFTASLLLIPVYFDKIKGETATTTKKTGLIVVVAKVIAGIAAFLMLKATDMGDVAVVQALDGLRFVFILIMTSVFAYWLPESAADKDTRPETFFRRLLFVIVITIGFALLFA